MDEIIPPLDPKRYRDFLQRSLAEDLGDGDITTQLTVPEACRGSGALVAKAPLVLAGAGLFSEVFRLLDPSVKIEACHQDGSELSPGQTAMQVVGQARALLTGERVALNLVQRLSGIATATRIYVRALEGTQAHIVDTRKTIPGLRDLEKYAVRVGGALNHRRDLGEAVLIKDNHIRLAGGVRAALDAVKPAKGKVAWIEVEVTDRQQLQEALSRKPDMVLLDNMSPAEVKEAVCYIRSADPARSIRIEASGGITLHNVRDYGEAGVDWISVGALTHSAPAVDLSFEIEPL